MHRLRFNPEDLVVESFAVPQESALLDTAAGPVLPYEGSCVPQCTWDICQTQSIECINTFGQGCQTV